MKKIDLRVNGNLFPLGIMTTFKKFAKKEHITGSETQELTYYQKFIGEFIKNTEQYRNILIYHELGTGKTISAINICNILYSANKNININVLIRASLQIDPGINHLNKGSVSQEIMKNIIFIYYDSPSIY